MDLWIGNYN